MLYAVCPAMQDCRYLVNEKILEHVVEILNHRTVLGRE